AKIPVVGFNSGIDQYQKLGALMYFGSDETLAGTTAGKRIGGEGAKHPLCVIQQAGSVALEARCAGVKSAVPGTENIQVNAAADIQSGKIEFSIDQQPYVQGYMAITSLYLYLKNGNDIGGGKAVLTGPSFVDKSNIDKILPFTKNNTR